MDGSVEYTSPEVPTQTGEEPVITGTGNELIVMFFTADEAALQPFASV